MKLIYLSLLAMITLGSCKVKSNADNSPNKNLKTYTYLALGDSYTIGESVDLDKNFPNQLAASLKSDKSVVATPKIIAKTGWTTNNLIEAIKTADLKTQYYFVTLLIGVNNQYRGYDIDTYKKEFKQLLETAIAKAGSADHVFVVSIPDYGVTPFAQNSDREKIGREIDAYNQIALHITTQAKANYLDITPISREAKTDLTLVAQDGLHPSAKMYQRWVSLLAKQIKDKLPIN